MIGNNGKAIEITPEGGLAYWIINKTGANSVKGSIVEPSDTTDNAIQLIGFDDPDPIGIIYDNDIADGELVRVVFSGIAEVLFFTTTTRAYFARNAQVGDAGAIAGQAISEPLPTPPFATDKHFLEIGHVLESKGAPGLAKVNLHFN